MVDSIPSRYSVIDPGDDPSVVSRPPAPRKPKRPGGAPPAGVPSGASAECAPPKPPVADAPPPTAPYPEPAAQKRRYTRVNFTTDAGVYSVPALSVIACPFGVMVELPIADDAPSFVPSVGTKLSVGDAVASYPCYYPGTEFDKGDSKILVFVRAEDNDGKA